MRIAIDLQGAQGASRHRGIGRYSLALAQAIVRNAGKHEIIVVLNGMFPDSIEPIRAAFHGMLPQENIRVWQAVAPTNSLDAANVWRRQAGENLRVAFLASQGADIVLVTSLFEGYGDDALCTIDRGGLKTAVILYDLIPLIQSDIYLKPNKQYEAFYYEKLAELKKADLYLGISESSRREAVEHLQVGAEQAVNISAAADDCFKPVQVSAEQRTRLLKKFGLTKPFLMYSGATDERKNHLRLIKAFSNLPQDLKNSYQLAIVGQLPQENRLKFSDYAQLCGLDPQQVVITGRVSDEELVWLYNLCHLFVFPSTHEGFGLPALEAMHCGAAVIGSNNTSVPEVIGRKDGLFDPFDDRSIAAKIAEVLSNERMRQDLMAHGLKMSAQFSWDICARRTLQAFENLQLPDEAARQTPAPTAFEEMLVAGVGSLRTGTPDEFDLLEAAKAIAQNHLPRNERRIFVDVSELCRRDSRTGIQRVVRSILAELLANPPAGYSVEPIYAMEDLPGYRYASSFKSATFAQTEHEIGNDDPIEAGPGDVFLGLDLQHHVVLSQASYHAHLRRLGVAVYFVVYDLLPILLPRSFPEGTAEVHAKWLEILSLYDGAICISRAVADELYEWLKVSGGQRLRPYKIGWFHLGADVARSLPSMGMPPNATEVLQKLAERPTFICVGTVEPRKGQMQIVLAFEKLWRQGVEVNLVIVGKHGWHVELLVDMLRNHSERNQRLFWLEGVSDEYLEKVYASATCLIAASEGEGFGLPLIEAAQHKKSIIARDIPVFREVAGDHAYYFTGSAAEDLALAVTNWLNLDKANRAPRSIGMPWLTWQQSTHQIVDVAIDGNWYKDFMPDKVLRFVGSDIRLHNQVGKREGRTLVTDRKAGYLLFGPYAALSAGYYTVLLHGTGTAAGAHVDVVMNAAQKTLGAAPLQARDTGILAALSIELAQDCSDLEVRVWVEKGSDLSISLLEIAPESPPVRAAGVTPAAVSKKTASGIAIQLITPKDGQVREVAPDTIQKQVVPQPLQLSQGQLQPKVKQKRRR